MKHGATGIQDCGIEQLSAHSPLKKYKMHSRMEINMAKHIWKKQGFEEFMKGSFGNGGQNIYVSKGGVLQRIHLYDVTGNGYPDLIYSNSQSMGERPKIDVYRGKPGKEAKKLRNRGTFDGTMADLTGDRKLDLIIACQHDGVTSDITSMIYYSSPEVSKKRTAFAQ